MGTSTQIQDKSLIRGLVAGLVGGVVGAGVILVAEEIIPPRPQGEPAPLAVLAGRGKDLPPAVAPSGWQALHWAFGALAGGVYGMAAEIDPSLAAWRGAAFGIALNHITHEFLLPRLGLVTSKEEQPTQTRVSEWISHAAYGVATDSVRRVVRGIL